MQNRSVLSKSKRGVSTEGFPGKPALLGKRKENHLGQLTRRGCKPHSYAFAVYLLVCPPTLWWKARQEVSLANWTWSRIENGTSFIFNYLARTRKHILNLCCLKIMEFNSK